ncbi:Rhodopsin, GQ-coupled [Holothuria leucospilota]|uniref:Rhodopsin, GQ-coupled n=1 Tax=Holothuria leucospilota TaxID=206669 RepID=A0A9Q1CGQ5_HOLLE|nr:Rhodopsin, GQ-coupled [Holothuria leucospilota]
MESTELTATTQSSFENIQEGDVLMKVFYAIFAILGVMGNGLVLFVFYKTPDLHVPTNILIGHQSLVDLVFSVILFLNFIPPSIDLETLGVSHPVLSNLTCKVWVSEFVYWSILKVSTINLVFLTLERYFAVVHPIKFIKIMNRRIAISMCILAWILGIVLSIYFPFIHRVEDDGDCTSRSVMRGSPERYAIVVLSVVTTLILPVGVMLYAYLMIFWTLRPVKDLPDTELPSNATTIHMGDTQTNGVDSRKMEFTRKAGFRDRCRRNVLITFFLVSLSYTICWTPDMVLYFHHNVVTRHEWSDPIHQFVILLAVSNSWINPVIYTWKYRGFQKGLKDSLLKSRKDVTRVFRTCYTYVHNRNIQFI